MKLGPIRITTEINRSRAPRSEPSATKEKLPKPASTARQRKWGFRVPRFKPAASSLLPRKTGPVQTKDAPGFDTPLFHELPPPLQEHSKAQAHLWDYLNELPVDEIGVPQYYPTLSRKLAELEYKNLIYPVGNGVFVHLRPDNNDVRDYYIPVEPSANPSLGPLMEQVDMRLLDMVQELGEMDEDQDKAQVLKKCLERICSTKGGRGGLFHRGMLKVTEEELTALKYLIVRDKEGLGVIEPLISDPYIEDISCAGVGCLFVEHKIFGGLKSTVSFDSVPQLDRFVIRLSERIGRPVTVREPIVDAVLPDGSRVNIVYGDDVSKKGSNFTIRKFNTVPMSLLDLIGVGTLSYDMAAYLSFTLGEGLNVFIAGETASGKTTLLNAVTTLVNPSHKIVSIEDTAELQVPHPNWIREVIRGRPDEGTSVTMFDLLRSSMRQRPNLIIIGEIRGEEGAIAFQAMQTGHSCMSTFHAASVEKLIQRLTGSPINVPKVYIDNLNLVVIISLVRLPDGSSARRVLSINEILGYDVESSSFNYVEVFRWKSSDDTFEFPGYMNSTLLEHVVAPKRGMTNKEARKIYDHLQDRAEAFKKIHERGVTNFYELHNLLSQAFRQGLIR